MCECVCLSVAHIFSLFKVCVHHYVQTKATVQLLLCISLCASVCFCVSHPVHTWTDLEG